MSLSVLNLRFWRSGGNGDLFVGERTDTGEYVVVKFLRDYRLLHARRAFEREVIILARNACGLVPLLAWDTDTERPYYVMPYFPGGSLSRFGGCLAESQIYSVAAHLAAELACFHAGWCAHGDVKPDNVLVDHEGLRLADPLGNGLGCAGLFAQNKGGGTPGYRAPEVGAGGAISKPGDVYSYGATLYEVLTGRRPQDGQRLDPTVEGYKNARIIGELIAACCQFDPSARPTMQEVVRVLRGERWTDILAARIKRQQVVAAACVVIAIFAVLIISSTGDA